MDNKLLENIAFQEHEDWKKDILSLLNNEPRWFPVKDANLVAKLDEQDSGEVPFVPSVYRKNNGEWEVDVLHANFYQLPKEYKETCLGLAERAVYILQNFGKGLSKDNRLNRCYKNALTMLSATEKQFEGNLEDLVKEFLGEKAKGNNFVYKIDGAYIFTKFDNPSTIYAKIYGMSHKDKHDLEDYYAINNSHQMRELDRGSQLSIEEIMARGEQVIPQILHEEWEKYVNKYTEEYISLQRSYGWNKDNSDETLKFRAKRSLLKVVQLIEDLNRGKSTKSVTPRIDNILELALIAKFGKNGNLIADNVGFVFDENPRKAKLSDQPQSTKTEDTENE